MVASDARRARRDRCPIGTGLRIRPPSTDLGVVPTWSKVPGSTVQFAGLPVGAFPVRVKKEKLFVHGHEPKMHVSQFPVRLNFAWTCHKLQGKTEPHMTLGTTNKVLDFNYTALSRVRSLKNLFILKGVNLSLRTLNSPSPHHTMLVKEMGRLNLLSAATIQKLTANISLQPVAPTPITNPNQGIEPSTGRSATTGNATNADPVGASASQQEREIDTPQARATTATAHGKKKKKKKTSRSKPVTFVKRAGKRT